MVNETERHVFGSEKEANRFIKNLEENGEFGAKKLYVVRTKKVQR